MALPPEEQEKLLQRLGGLASERAGRFLALLYPALADKKLRKLVKKDLFRLKTLGISVEEPKESGESALRKIETFRDAMALMSNYDATQTRVVLAAVELKKNQFLFAHAVIHFTRGLEEMRSLTTSRTELEEIARGYVARTQPPMVLANLSPLYAGYVIEEASLVSGVELDDARSLNRLLAAAKGDAKKPADIYRLTADPDAVPAAADTVLSDEIFQPFMLEWRGMDEDRKNLGNAVNPSIVLPAQMVQERKNAFFEELAEKEPVRIMLPRFKRMLEDSAYLFFSLREYDLYLGLMALLKDPPGIKAAFVRFLDKALAEVEKKEPEQPGSSSIPTRS